MSKHEANTAQIINRLRAAGYRAEASARGAVTVYDPMHSATPGSAYLSATGYQPVNIRALSAAWAFIEERS